VGKAVRVIWLIYYTEVSVLKRLGIFILTALLALPAILTGHEFSKRVVEKVWDHSVAVTAIYWTLDEDDFRWKMRQSTEDPKIPFIPEMGPARFYIAYIGAGTVLPDDYVVTVEHLFDYDKKTQGMICMVWFPDGRVIEANIVKLSEHSKIKDWNDYALLKLRQPAGLPGIKIAKREPQLMDPILFSGSTGGMMFRLRAGYLEFSQGTLVQEQFSGRLAHVQWFDFPFYTVHPGGPGDSGGGIFNDKGELIGIMYCGVTNYSEEYIFSNPLDVLRGWLKGTLAYKSLVYDETKN